MKYDMKYDVIWYDMIWYDMIWSYIIYHIISYHIYHIISHISYFISYITYIIYYIKVFIQEMLSEMSSAQWWPFCFGLNVLKGRTRFLREMILRHLCNASQEICAFFASSFYLLHIRMTSVHWPAYCLFKAFSGKTVMERQASTAVFHKAMDAHRKDQ